MSPVNTNSALLNQMADIRSIDNVSWWPLAIGWWLILIIIILIIGSTLSWHFYCAYKHSQWQFFIKQELLKLEKAPHQQNMAKLSEILRKITLQKFPRYKCASLTDKAWLKWLSQHDPNKFNWEQHGKSLLTLPYAPQNKTINQKEYTALIQAIKGWLA